MHVHAQTQIIRTFTCKKKVLLLTNVFIHMLVCITYVVDLHFCMVYTYKCIHHMMQVTFNVLVLQLNEALAKVCHTSATK